MKRAGTTDLQSPRSKSAKLDQLIRESEKAALEELFTDDFVDPIGQIKTEISVEAFSNTLLHRKDGQAS